VIVKYIPIFATHGSSITRLGLVILKIVILPYPLRRFRFSFSFPNPLVLLEPHQLPPVRDFKKAGVIRIYSI
jgi:hypothetical protein